MIKIKLIKKQEKRSNASIFLFFCLLKFYLDLIVREKKECYHAMRKNNRDRKGYSC